MARSTPICVQAREQPPPSSTQLGFCGPLPAVTAHFGHHTEITLQGVRNRAYTLRLFVGDGEIEVEMRDNHTWTPVQRPYVLYFPNTYTNWRMCVFRDVSPTSQIRAEVRVKSGHSFWAKYQDASEVIELDGVFSDYWGSKNPEFTVLSQSLSPTNTHRSD